MRYGLAACVTGAALMLAAPAMAEKNAVSQLNIKAEGFGGILSEGEAYGGAGSVAIPILEGLGAQVDVLAGALDGEFTYGIGGHLFWRAPSTGLIGLVASYLDADGLYDVFRIGGETEWYFGDVTLGGTLGWQTAETDYIEDDYYFAGVEGKFYATDDVALNLGVTALGFEGNEDFQFNAGVEFGLMENISLYVDGKVGTETDEVVLGGIRIALWGEGKTLKHRDRYDDPSNVLLRNVRETEAIIKDVRHIEDLLAGGGGGGGGGGIPIIGGLF